MILKQKNGKRWKKQYPVIINSENSYAIYLIKVIVTPTETLYLCSISCLLYTSDAADDSLRVDLGGRRIIKKKNFFKQKTAYEISACLVGSEMCIRDSCVIVSVFSV